jgi:hypothetical protein
MSIINLPAELPKYVGKNIRHICPNNFISNTSNHCAHFVGHVMGYTFGYCCKGQTGIGQGKGASIKVHEIFNNCQKVGEWANKPAGSCLAFVTDASTVNLDTKRMINIPKKHVGIYCDGCIYHYSNSKEKVVAVQPPEFGKHYYGSNIKVYFGTFPIV